MSTENAVAINDELLREIGAMATEEDISEVKTLPVMKINYDSDSIHPAGSWVVGQRKKDDAIIEEGQKVKGFVILVNRNRYALYNEADTTKNCNSPLHKQGEKVRGSNYRNACGKGCAHRAEGVDPRCQAQKTAFGLAITEGGDVVECVAYLKGSGYMPFANYIEDVVRVKSGNTTVTVPTYTFVTLLGTEKKKNGSVNYWVPIFTRGPAFKIEQLREFEVKRQQVQAYVDSLNASIASEIGNVRAVVAEDVTPLRVVTPDAVEVAPWEDEAAAAGEPDDIEAAIAKAMGSLK